MLKAYHVFLPVYLAEVIAAVCYRKHKIQYNPVRISAVINAISILILGFITKYQPLLGGFAIILLPFSVIGLLIIIIDETDSYIVSSYYASLFLAVMVSFSSNVGPSSFICPLIYSCSMTVILLNLDDYAGKVLLVIFIAALLCFNVTEDFEGKTGDYDTTVQSGPLKGLKGTEKQVAEYEAALEDMMYIRSLPLRNVSLVTWKNWGYFVTDKTIATNSTYLYFWDRDSYVQTEEAYYDSHSDRYPAYVYVDRENPYFEQNDALLNEFEAVKTLENGDLYIRH